MASSKEAFERFWTWKNSRTLLRLTLWEKGQAPTSFVGAVVLPEEEELRVAFLNHDERKPVVILFEDCSFRIGERFLMADRFGEEFFECGDTGRQWTPMNLDI